MQEKVILGIDISKKTMDVCLRLDGKDYHKVFANTQEGFNSCLGWCQNQRATSLWICLEVTGWYWGR